MQLSQSKLHTRLCRFVPVLIFVLCLLQPVMDAVSYWQSELELEVSLTFVPRALLLALTVLTGFALSRKKWIYFAMGGALAAFYVIRRIITVQNGYTGLFSDLSYYIQIVSFPLTVLSFISMLKGCDGAAEAMKKALALALAETVLLAAVSVATGTEPYTYHDKHIGIRGWCVWENAQSAIVSMLVPLTLVYLLEHCKKRFPVFCAGSAAALACLFILGTRTAYASLVAAALVLALAILVSKSHPKRFAAALVIFAVAFAALYPVSPMVKNQKAVARNYEIREEIFNDLLAEGEKRAEASGLTGQEREDVRLEPVYRYFLTDFVDTFGLEETLEVYNRSDSPDIMPGVREYKLNFCKTLMKHSVPATKFVGIELNRMFVGNGFDCENDFHAIYFLYGLTGIAAIILFLAVFVLRILRVMVRDFKRLLAPELCGYCVAFGTCLIHAIFTCGVLRRANALFFLAAVLSLIWLNTALPGKKSEEKGKEVAP